MTKDEYINSRYDNYLHYWARIGLGFGPIAVISLIPLDYLASPENFRLFLLFRSCTAALLLCLYVINKKFPGRKLINSSILLAAVAVSAMLALMIARFGGHQSPYAAGFILLGIFVSGVVPLSFAACLISSVMLALDMLIPHVRFGEEEPSALDASALQVAVPEPPPAFGRGLGRGSGRGLGPCRRVRARAALDQRLLHSGTLLALGITVHNIPEGIAVGAGFTHMPEFGLLVAAAIMLHNIPEGIGTALPLAMSGLNRWQAFRVALFSGLAEPLGALLAATVLSSFHAFIPAALAFAAGVMVFVAGPRTNASANGSPAAPWIHVLTVAGLCFAFLPRLLLLSVEAVTLRTRSLRAVTPPYDAYFAEVTRRAWEKKVSALRDLTSILTAETLKFSESVASYVRDELYNRSIVPRLVDFRDLGGRIADLEADNRFVQGIREAFGRLHSCDAEGT